MISFFEPTGACIKMISFIQTSKNRIESACRMVILGLIAVSPCIAHAQVKSTAWPKYRAGLTNSGVSAFWGATSTVNWTSKLSFSTFSDSMAIGTDGTVYVGSADGKLSAIDNTLGSVKWFYQTNGEVDASPVIGKDGTIYFGSTDGNMYAIDGSAGTLKWSFPTLGSIYSSATIDPNGSLYFGSMDGNLYSLNSSTGVLNWTFPSSVAGSVFASSPAIDSNGILYIGCMDSSLYAIDTATGK